MVVAEKAISEKPKHARQHPVQCTRPFALRELLSTGLGTSRCSHALTRGRGRKNTGRGESGAGVIPVVLTETDRESERVKTHSGVKKSFFRLTCGNY